jgi:hypothetical protein
MAFASLDLFASVVAHVSAVRIRFDALAIEDSGRRTTALALLLADPSAQAIIESFPGVIQLPFAKDVVDRFPTREVARQEPPLNTAFDDIKYSVHDSSPVDGRSSRFVRLRKYWLKQLPLLVSETRRVVKSDFHRFNGAALLIGNALAEGLSQNNSLFFLLNRTFQTGS